MKTFLVVWENQIYENPQLLALYRLYNTSCYVANVKTLSTEKGSCSFDCPGGDVKSCFL